MDLNNLENVSSMINSLMGGAGIEGLGDISKIAGALGNKGVGGFGGKYIIILFIILIALFGNKGNCRYNTNTSPQYACCCYSRKNHRKDRSRNNRRNCYCNYYGNNNRMRYGSLCSNGNSNCNTGFGGCGNIIFIVIILLLIRGGRGACETKQSTIIDDIFNFNADDNKVTEDNEVEFVEANEEE